MTYDEAIEKLSWLTAIFLTWEMIKGTPLYELETEYIQDLTRRMSELRRKYI